MSQQYNYQEFLAFVLLYASHVDIEYSEEEEAKVRSLLSPAAYEKVYNDFSKLSDYAALQLILSYKGVYFPTADRKAELLKRIKQLFFADGEYSPMEQELYHFLDKLL